MGAALLRTPEKLCSILEALVKDIVPEFEIGISVKIRLLETPEETENLVRKLCATGITGLTVHCRTTSMRPRERAIREQLKMIADVCREAGVACLMNGGVENRSQAEQLVVEYGVDGAMIATAAETNSSCFRSKENGGPAPWREVVEQYLKVCMEVENRFGNTKYLLGHLVPGKEPVYRCIAATKTYTQICELLGLQHLLEAAREADVNLNLLPEAKEKTEQTKKQARKNNKSAMAARGEMRRIRSPGAEGRKPRSTRGVEAQKPAMALSI
jgi:tRNA-dihydrouridine synthase 2